MNIVGNCEDYTSEAVSMIKKKYSGFFTVGLFLILNCFQNAVFVTFRIQKLYSYINPSTDVQTIDKVALALFQSTLLRRLIGSYIII